MNNILIVHILTLGISYTPKLRYNESSYSEFHDIVNKSQLPLLARFLALVTTMVTKVDHGN